MIILALVVVGAAAYFRLGAIAKFVLGRLPKLPYLLSKFLEVHDPRLPGRGSG